MMTQIFQQALKYLPPGQETYPGSAWGDTAEPSRDLLVRRPNWCHQQLTLFFGWGSLLNKCPVLRASPLQTSP